MPAPADVLAALVRSDPGTPRLTWYDDGSGERLELSAAVLANWVAKAANLLQDDGDAGPGTRVTLALPPHWRAVYWALATWSVGATLVLGEPPADDDILVGCDPEVTHDGYAVHVTLAALARANPDTPPGAVDEARELATYGDRFEPYAVPLPTDPALLVAGAGTAVAGTADSGTAYRGTAYRSVAYQDVVEERDWPAHPRVRLTGDLERVLRDTLAAWAMAGSVVLITPGDGDQGDRLAAERVTVDLA